MTLRLEFFEKKSIKLSTTESILDGLADPVAAASCRVPAAPGAACAALGAARAPPWCIARRR
jgi:hypothetical protein